MQRNRVVGTLPRLRQQLFYGHAIQAKALLQELPDRG
jgi:hypothetical protein